MRNLVFAIFCFLTVNAIPAQSAFANPTAGPSIANIDNVPDAVAQISATLESQGFEIVLVVDHSAAAARVGLDLAPTQVVFARPARNFERRLLRRSHTIGVDLPLKFLVFEKDGEIQVSSNALGYLVDRHDIAVNDPLLRLLGITVTQFGDAPNGLITVESLQTVEDTVQSLQVALSSNPAFRIPLVLDYELNADLAGFKRNRRAPILVVFGNPNVGTPLMQADQRIGIDLPQKFLVWATRSLSLRVITSKDRKRDLN